MSFSTYEIGGSSFESIVNELIKNLDKAVIVVALRDADGNLYKVVEKQHIESSKKLVLEAIALHPDCCKGCKISKTLSALQKQLENPQFSFVVHSGRAVHFIPIQQMESIKCEFTEFLEWKKNKASS